MHKHSLVLLSLPSGARAHVRGASDDYGPFIPVPPSLDPLSSADTSPTSISSSHSAEVTSGSEHQPSATTITTGFTMRPERRHAENTNRTSRACVLSEVAGDDSLGWPDDGDDGQRMVRWMSNH